MESIQEDSFSSDAELDEEDEDSSSDADAKLEEDDVFDVDFLKCYSALRKKDAKIYDEKVRFFEPHDSDSTSQEGEDGKDDEEFTASTSKSNKNKTPKMTLLDHHLAVDPETIEEPLMEHAKVDLTKEVSKSFYEKELEEIKKSIETVGAEIDSDSDDDLLVVKDPSESTSMNKPNRRLKSILDKIEDQEDEDLKHLKQVWNDPDGLSEEDKFLRDYILNKRYLPKTNEDDDHADDEDEGNEFFSKNIDELSDAEDDDKAERPKRQVAAHHSDERNFDKIVRIPRNSTKTIRDLVEKQEKKEKRLKKLEKERKRKKALKDADCEDIVGDLPTKFHYRETEPNDYGLTAQELLLATDGELDKWVSLRDCIAYKTPEEEEADKRKFAKKRDDIALKRKIFKSIYGDGADQTDEHADQSTASVQSATKRKKKRGRKRKRTSDSESSFKESANNSLQEDAYAPSNDEGTEKTCVAQESNRQRKKKKRKRGLNHKKFAKIGVAPDRLLAYGISKTRLRKSKIL